MAEETAEMQGISLNAAFRLLIRRGYSWIPDGRFAYPDDTHGPSEGRKPAAVTAGQTSIMDDDQGATE